MAKVKPYGSWKSPITSDMIVSETIGLGQVVLDGPDIYWIEVRPSEGGRSVIVRLSADGKREDVTPPSFNARTRVHEYGGGDFTVTDGTVYFSNFADQRLYRQDPGSDPRPLTEEAARRYADGIMDRRRNRLICVGEDHSAANREPVNALISVDLESGEQKTLVAGCDFYSSPRLSPDGSTLAWLAWNHPNMPWDGTELWMGRLNTEGQIEEKRQAAGGPEESIFQPEWSPEGTLFFVSDRSGWWNLYQLTNGEAKAVAPLEAEFGMPQWVFGMSTYAFDSTGGIIGSFNAGGEWQLARLDIRTGSRQTIPTPYTDVSFLRAGSGQAVFIGGSPTEPRSVVRLDLSTRTIRVLRRSAPVTVNPEFLSSPEAIEFPTKNNQKAHAFFYRPKNPDFRPPAPERAPLLVISHGGPTAAASSALNLAIQYWTSRGIAIADVNYGGSTGYGRAYRRRLEGQWGIVDVDDCVNCARYLAGRGEVDGDRLAIRGGSAGGYTTLCALTFRDLFKAGASHYGVSDLEALARDTHKFESRYLDRLVGPYPARRDIYSERSPINFVERLSCPVIFFQGLEDKIVPPSQAERMVDALRAKGLPVAYVPFEGEQHGFRRAANIKRALDAELYFYSRIFSFDPADSLEPIPIHNL
jgi:dipeptidyl aminopeptidase/acylaminoacyl peptidase